MINYSWVLIYIQINNKLSADRLKIHWRMLRRSDTDRSVSSAYNDKTTRLQRIRHKDWITQVLTRCLPGLSLTSCRYGYRGRDCRANIYLLPTGEIVYFIASVVALFNYEERTQRHYLGHTDCVKWWENTYTRIICCSPIGWCVMTCVTSYLCLCPSVWQSILIRSGSQQDRLQEWTKMDGWGVLLQYKRD